MRPGWTGDEFEAPVTINSKGLRNPEIPYEKPANTYRILALGDSWTFGFRMNEPDAYPRQLERMLQADAAARGDTRQHRGDQRRRRRLLDRPGGRVPRGRGLEVPAGSRAGELLPGERHPQQAVQVPEARGAARPAPVAARAVRVPAEALPAPVHQGRAAHAEAEDRRAAREGRREGRGRGQGRPRAGRGRLDRRLPRRARAAGRRCAPPSPTSRSRPRPRASPSWWCSCPTPRTWSATTSATTRRSSPCSRAAASEAGLPLFDLEPTFQPWQGKEDEICFKRQRHPNAMGYGVIAKAVARGGRAGTSRQAARR